MLIRDKSKKRSAARAVEDGYASDDGFVVDSDGGDEVPLAKRAKTSTAARKETNSSRPRKKSAKAKPAGSADIDDNGDMFWEISNNRRVTISEFKGKRLVSIREYYEKDGKHLPGKKGISMPMDQYSKLMSIVPEVETALKAQGEEVVRPAFKSSGDGDDDDDDGGGGGADGEAEEVPGERERLSVRVGNGERKGNGVKKDKRKKNFEATSEEEEGEEAVAGGNEADED
ncbi:hypothetical protein FGG08_004917 [Glutinoglossum americanum]|uniref:Transcriptional coactivator p15 (PC4) C-terminal domain-containing protein n=1 Tax=Glutinoglossum americanum TaxID=1670608 RepID=A0A9P8KZ09_9PEZI|nr:hypothetical protein FGG08_004917 [Glutinoglossum americanum]